MDETRGIIRRGCNLARALEENLDNVANQPELVSWYCDEIIRVFSHVKERISHAKMVLDVGHDHHELPVQQQMEVVSGVQEWLQSQPALDQLLRAQPQFLGSRGAFGEHGGALTEPAPEGKMKEIDQQEQVVGHVLPKMVAEFPMRFGDDSRPVEVSNVSRGSSSLQRQRRRSRDDGEKKTLRMPAPRMGNTDIAPEDGYTWRKYGQKDILNSRFPRGYFRCTHQKLYNCPAKKLVQRVDDDPNMFQVTYRGEHTCHLSSTAPSAPPTSLQIRQDIIPQVATILHPPPPPGPSNSAPLSHWLSMDIISPAVGEGTSSVTAGMQMHRGFSLASAATSNSGAGPSSATTRLRDYQPVADMADVMFNSGSSSNNSMDLIFPSMDDKWDSGEKKN